MPKIFLGLLLFIVLLSTKFLGQSVIIGKVIDREDGKPLSHANVRLLQAENGSITNTEGEFRLLCSPYFPVDTILVSYLGYQSKQVSVKGAMFIQVELEAVPFETDEVLITPDSTLYKLLKRAYDRIETNYPQSSTLLRGFYREMLLNEQKEHLYISESTLDFFKTKYTKGKKNDNGQVRIKKLRNVIAADADSFNNIDFYNGPFMVNWADFVKQRAFLINPKYYRYFRYRVNGLRHFDGHEIYEIGFESKRTEDSEFLTLGKLYLTVDSLAYMGMETNRKMLNEIDSLSAPSGLFSPTYEPLNWKLTVRYFEYGGKWNLKYISYSGNGKNYLLNTVLNFDNTFVTTSVEKDKVNPIPFDERFDDMEIIANQRDSLNTEFFQEYAIIEQDSQLVEGWNQALSRQVEKAFTQKDSIESNRTQESGKLKRIIRNQFVKLRLGYLVQYTAFSNNFSSIAVDFTQIRDQSIIAYSTPDVENVLKLQVFYEYDLTNRLSISGSILQDLGKGFHYEGWVLGANYTFLLKSVGKPLFLEPEIFYGHSIFGYSSGKLENISPFSLNGKNFKSNALEFIFGHRQKFLQSGFQLRQTMGTFGILKINFHLGFGYLWELSNRRIALVEERNEWALFKKKTRLNLPNVEFETNYDELDGNHPESTERVYRIRTGFSFEF